MPNLETHINTSLPVLFGSVASAIVAALGLPIGAIVMALASALWAVWQNATFTRKQAFGWWLAGSIAALGLCVGTAEFIHFLTGFKPQLQWLAGLIAYAFIDKEWRATLGKWLKRKAENA